MLQTINDNAKGWVAYLVVGLISVPFALFGISSYLGGGDKRVAATVNGEDISVREVQNELLQQKQRLTSMFGGRMPPGFDDTGLKSQALEGLINQALLRQNVENSGYQASDAEVFSIISSTPSFQKEGVFDAATYEKLLKSNRRNKASYEATLRTDLSNRQLSDGITNTSYIPEAQAAAYQALSKQARDFETFTLKLNDYKDQIKPSDDNVKAYYDSHSDQYMTEEKIKLSYVRLKVADLADGVSVTPEQLQSFYDDTSADYITGEQRKIAHILIKIVDEKDDDAKKHAEDLHKRITSGEVTFEAILLEKVENRISGDMGFLVQGDMGPVFEKAAFALKKDELSAVVKTDSGYELLKVSEIKPEVQQTLEQVKDKVEKNYRKEKADKLFQTQVETLNTVAFENEASLDPAGQSVGLEVQTTDWFTRKGGKDFAADPKVLAEAFSEKVFDQAKNSNLIELTDTDVAVIRVSEKKAPVLKPLADVSEQIKKAIIDTTTRKLISEKGESVLAKLKSTGNWSALSDLDAKPDEVEKFTAVDRKASKPSSNVVRKVFAMNTPVDNKRVFSNTVMPTGDYVFISLTTVKDGDGAVDDAARDLYANAIGSRERSAVMKALREEADVVIIKEASE
ncbi:MAG: SurA N-terminal domain-containing protein [Cocleimonas sp.]|nr:SurA N-terminal domain-containing protein [Cocleimonas sp.]